MIGSTISRHVVGSIAGTPVEAFRLSGGDTSIEVISFGAILRRLTRPDRNGQVDDIVLGYDDPEAYVGTPGNAGAVCGRYGNRIANGRFTLDGTVYELPRNNGDHHLHGGAQGFGKRFWTPYPDPDGNAVEFRLLSEDGDAGYPGTLEASTRYALAADGTLTITMSATTDRRTIVNLVHHGYWNLAGHASGSIAEQVLQLDADHYTPTHPDKIPTGEIAPLAGTAFDFSRPRAIGADITTVAGGGYDHNWCLRPAESGMRRCAVAWDRASGRRLELHTNQPGVQFYTANHFANAPATGKGGAPYGAHAGFALETQTFPNAPNEPAFPSPVLSPGASYDHRMVLRFSTEQDWIA
ncbi:aldose 1-epimerase [Devosia enhydra]|uniref:Aldose 1-epimerase n=1 Tax=Devosia enhydra TaxID=665118 RepID=A0A1K2HXX8_9HYPH|nr:aldose epimerase family protein [Devosia enhydra]SFZ84677.1 aldose 1-epimerase [Devosia enhydra]